MEVNDARKVKALNLVLGGKKLGAIASELDVSVRSIQRWMDEPEFVEAINEANAAARQLAIVRNAQELTEDLEEARESRRLLIQIRNDESAPIHARIRCAALLMTRGDRALRSMGVSPMSENRGMGVSPMSKAVDKPRQNTTTGDISDEKPPRKTKLRIPRQNLSEHDKLIADELEKAERENPRQTTTKDDIQSSNTNKSNDLAVQSKIEPPPSRPLQNVAFATEAAQTAPPSPAAEKARMLAKFQKELQDLNKLERRADDAERNGFKSDQMATFRAESAKVRAKLEHTITLLNRTAPEGIVAALGV